jgi:hypothetical protein
VGVLALPIKAGLGGFFSRTGGHHLNLGHHARFRICDCQTTAHKCYNFGYSELLPQGTWPNRPVGGDHF